MSSDEDQRLPSLVEGFQILTVPGRGNAGAHHWQTFLESTLCEPWRVVQANWHRPDLESWSQRVSEHAGRAERPVLVVAHGFGCLASVAAGLSGEGPIVGALLVAPEEPGYTEASPAIAGSLPFPSYLVLSRNDPSLSYDAGCRLAGRWGAGIVDAGDAGRIDVESGHGPWPAAHAMIERLAREAKSMAWARHLAWQAERDRQAEGERLSRISRNGRPRRKARE